MFYLKVGIGFNDQKYSDRDIQEVATFFQTNCKWNGLIELLTISDSDINDIFNKAIIEFAKTGNVYTYDNGIFRRASQNELDVYITNSSILVNQIINNQISIDIQRDNIDNTKELQRDSNYLNDKLYLSLTRTYSFANKGISVSVDNNIEIKKTMLVRGSKGYNISNVGAVEGIISDVKEMPISENKISEMFEKLWKVYPRKINKVQARKTFGNKLKGLNEETSKDKGNAIYILLKQNIIGWSNEKNGEGRQLEMIPHFSSWLNANIEDSKYKNKK